MSKVVDLRDFSSSRAIRRGQGLWRRRFPEELTSRTRLTDLSDKTLLTLARLEEDIMSVVIDLVMGALGLGRGTKFQDLSGEPKMKVLDSSLFLIEQIRWECMRRLGWVNGFAGEEHPIVELVLGWETLKAEYDPPFPQLTKTHARYDEFCRRRDLDGEVIVRGLIPAAITALGQKVG